MDIVYDYDDIFSYIAESSIYTKRFKTIDIISSQCNRCTVIVEDINEGKICILKAKIYNNNNEIEVFNILKEQSHINIEKIYDVIVGETYYFVLSEYIPGKNLADIKINKKILPYIIEEMIDGIQFLHSLNIIHGDIKPENIMYDGKNIKIIDFDLARISQNFIKPNKKYGTIKYMAPESFDLNIYSKKTDYWSLGISLYKIITNEFPYGQEFYNKHDPKDIDLSKLEKYKSLYGLKIINFIKNLLEIKENDRKCEYIRQN